MPGILSLDVNGLYIILAEQDVKNKWHWSLYLHRGTNQGWNFHITRAGDADWVYDQRTSNRITISVRIVLALKVAIIPPEMHQALRDRLGTREAGVKMERTERFGELTCRTWLLRALDELDSEGYISIKPGYTVEDIGNEAKGMAMNIQDEADEQDRRLEDMDRVAYSDFFTA